MLTFKKLKEINWNRCKSWHDPNSWSLAEWTNALCGESGEAANITKKMKRLEQDLKGPSGYHNNSDYATLKKELEKELADVVIYADLIASKLGIDLEDAVINKFNETSKKYEFKDIL